MTEDMSLNDYLKGIKRMHWHIVRVPSGNSYHLMERWREENNFGDCIFLGMHGENVTYLFERDQDAVMFALRWG